MMKLDNVETRVWVDGKELSDELVNEGIRIFGWKNFEEGYVKGVDAGLKRGLVVGVIVGGAIAGAYGYKLYKENKLHRENMVKLQALSEKLRIKVENAQDDRKENTVETQALSDKLGRLGLYRKENMGYSRNEKEEVK